MIFCKTEVKTVITDEMLEKREKIWKKRLPEAFKKFIKENNGGVPNKKIVISDKWVIEKFFCIVPKISESEFGWYDIDAIITKYDAYLVFDENSIGTDLIPFAQLNHDSLLCLCYETEIPSVAVWQFSGAKKFNPKYSKCYDNFDSFLSIID